MVIFGGIYEITKELNDLYMFDFAKRKWITVFEESNSPVRGGRDGSHSFAESDPFGHTAGVTSITHGSPMKKTPQP